MSKPDLLKITRKAMLLAGIFITIVFSISIFAPQGSDDGLHSPKPQYLSSDGPNDDPNSDEEKSSSVVNETLFPNPRFMAYYLSEKPVGLHFPNTIISVLFNRAPPHQPQPEYAHKN